MKSVGVIVCLVLVLFCVLATPFSLGKHLSQEKQKAKDLYHEFRSNYPHLKEEAIELLENAYESIEKYEPSLVERKKAVPKNESSEPGEPSEGGQIKVYNLSDKIFLVRTNIAGIIYATLALEVGMVGYLDCEFVWYEVQVYEVNTNDEMCSTGTPVDVYCGNTVVVDGNSTVGYEC